MEKTIKSRAIKTVFKFLGLAFIVFVYALVLWRICSDGMPSSMKRLEATDALKKAYAEAEENAQSLNLFYQKQTDLTYGENNDGVNIRGYFSIPKAAFCDAAQQLQLVLRYNNSTLKHVREDFQLESAPSGDADAFEVKIVVVYDMTPENTEDNLLSEYPEGAVKEVEYDARQVASDKKNMYNYRKFVVDGVQVEGGELPVIAVYADIYYCGSTGGNPYASLCLYSYLDKNQAYKLSSAEIKSLK